MNGSTRPTAGVGFPYGAMPIDSLLHKMEMTQTEGGEGDGGFGTDSDIYHGFARGEIVDWSPDAPLYEGDHVGQTEAHRSATRGKLNLWTNGTRGSDPQLPRNPELFLGHLGNDPRGAGNLPRFDRGREHVLQRAGVLAARMQDSVGHDGGPGTAAHQVAERPRTHAEVEAARVAMHLQSRQHLRIFTTSKDGRATGRATRVPSAGDRRARREAQATSHEAGLLPAAGPEGRADAESAPGRKEGALTGSVAPWAAATGDAEMGVARVAEGPAGAALRPAAAGAGSGARQGQDFAQQRVAAGDNRMRALAARMSAEAAARRAGARSGSAEQDFAAAREQAARRGLEFRGERSTAGLAAAGHAWQAARLGGAAGRGLLRPADAAAAARAAEHTFVRRAQVVAALRSRAQLARDPQAAARASAASVALAAAAEAEASARAAEVAPGRAREGMQAARREARAGDSRMRALGLEAANYAGAVPSSQLPAAGTLQAPDAEFATQDTGNDARAFEAHAPTFRGGSQLTAAAAHQAAFGRNAGARGSAVVPAAWEGSRAVPVSAARLPPAEAPLAEAAADM